MFKLFIGSIALVALPTLAQAGDYRTVAQPRQECWDEQVVGQGGNPGAALIGGIAGGLLGNTVGGGNGRTAATAVGVVTGAIVGDRGWGGASVQNVQRCRT
ncbi:MAG: glycine zipper 2TM domain-containing protein, partial [Herminiimonas sp.]|nr:glycine zipper 2TM domain-containing protein [Herminiimonas sp.]